MSGYVGRDSTRAADTDAELKSEPDRIVGGRPRLSRRMLSALRDEERRSRNLSAP